MSPILNFLQNPVHSSPQEIANQWHDQQVSYAIKTAYRLDPLELGAHLRRSFLGALAYNASPEAQNNLPCAWFPPCALDIFCREQLRSASGDGLPKPYILWADKSDEGFDVHLRVFGAANDWFLGVADSFYAGLTKILPWQQRLQMPMPTVEGRIISGVEGLEISSQIKDAEALSLCFLSPVDISGKKRETPIGKTILTRLLRRVDAVARWQGYGFENAFLSEFSTQFDELNVDISNLKPASYYSANKTKQARGKSTRLGTFTLKGQFSPEMIALLHIGERCAIGRGAVEGLGRYQIGR